MKQFSKKGVLLFAGAMAVCAFVLPAAASASSWGVVGSHHTLTSNGIGFTSATAGALISNCNNAAFTTSVTSAGTLTINAGTFLGCTSTAPGVGADCTTTSVPTGFPWRATAVTPTNIQIHNVNIDIRFEDMPGRAGSCGPLQAVSTNLTGTLINGNWTGNGNNQHEVTWNVATGTGLTSHPGNTPVFVNGTFRDAQQTLIVTG